MMDETVKIKKMKAQEQRRVRVARFTVSLLVGLLVGLAVGVCGMWPSGEGVVVAPTAVVITATPTAVGNGYQAPLPDVPWQSVLLVGERELVGRVGFVQHDGTEWRHYPYCTAVVACRWPMQPPNDTFRIFVEYGGAMNYIEADPLDPAVDVTLWEVRREVLP